MKGSSYRERDYAFGQVMLTLRTRLELTQTELANMLGVTRRAVIDWEGGLTYPKADLYWLRAPCCMDYRHHDVLLHATS